MSKYKDLCWLLIRRSLFTGEVASKCNSIAIPHNCYCGKLESLDHLFLKCEAAKAIWDIVVLKWSTVTGYPSPLPSPSLSTLATAGLDLPLTTPRWQKTLWQLLSMTAIFAIWSGRCNNVYGDDKYDYVGKFIINLRRVKKIAQKALPSLRGISTI